MHSYLRSLTKTICYNIVIVSILFATKAIADEPQQPARKPSASMKELRKQAANRQRRLIMNNDGGEPIKELKNITAENILALRTSPLAGTSVDSICYCSRASGFGMFTHFTKIGEIFTSTEGRYEKNHMANFIKAGLDPLKLVVDFSKKNNIEAFWSMRMNDTHDGSKTDYGPIIFRASKFKNAHPKYLMGTIDNRPKYGAWTAVDYGEPEIRDLAYRYIEEVCLNYNIDGIELDFFRHPVFFRPTSRGEEVTDKERAMMTELMQRIRTMADNVGKKRGRPILISIRSPDSVEYARAIGLDIEKWMRDDLIDLYVPSSYFQLNDWKYSVELGHKYGVKVYPSLDDSRVDDKSPNEMRKTKLAYRARAADVWASGADGVYLFNYYDNTDPDKSIYGELSDPKKLTQLDKDYFASYIGEKKAAGGNLPYKKHQNIETLNPENPKLLQVGQSITSTIRISELLEQINKTENKNVKFKLRLQFNSRVEPNSLKILLNDKPLKNAIAVGRWHEVQLDPAILKNGENRATITLQKATDRQNDFNEDDKKLHWTDMVIEARH